MAGIFLKDCSFQILNFKFQFVSFEWTVWTISAENFHHPSVSFDYFVVRFDTSSTSKSNNRTAQKFHLIFSNCSCTSKVSSFPLNSSRFTDVLAPVYGRICQHGTSVDYQKLGAGKDNLEMVNGELRNNWYDWHSRSLAPEKSPNN